MKKLVIKDLLSLENYDLKRDKIKNKLFEHKKNRSISIGNHILLLFEDYETIKYFNNSKKMTQLYKSPINYIIKEDYHPNKKGADLIYNLVSDEIKNILLN